MCVCVCWECVGGTGCNCDRKAMGRGERRSILENDILLQSVFSLSHFSLSSSPVLLAHVSSPSCDV